MEYRKIVIRVIYTSISIAAIAGVMTLFVQSGNQVIGKLLGTAISTGVTGGLLLLAIRAHDTPMTRPLGTALALLVCCIYVSIVSFIWLDLIKLHPLFNTLGRRFATTAIATTMCGMPILLGAACIPHRRGDVAGKVFVGIWLVVLISWLMDAWVDSSLIQDNIEYFSGPLMLYSPIALFVLIAKNTKLRLAGIVMVSLGCVAVQIGASISGGNLENTPILFDTGLIFGWASSVLGLINIITFRKEEFAIPWCERVAIFLSCIGLASLCYVIRLEIHDLPVGDLLGRISGSSVILASTAVLTIIVTQVVRSLIIVDLDGSELQAECPRCLQNVILPQGKSTCPFCNLHIRIRIESPGCRKCGYDLSGSIESNCCPECGELIVLIGSSD